MTLTYPDPLQVLQLLMLQLPCSHGARTTFDAAILWPPFGTTKPDPWQVEQLEGEPPPCLQGINGISTSSVAKTSGSYFDFLPLQPVPLQELQSSERNPPQSLQMKDSKSSVDHMTMHRSPLQAAQGSFRPPQVAQRIERACPVMVSHLLQEILFSFRSSPCRDTSCNLERGAVVLRTHCRLLTK